MAYKFQLGDFAASGSILVEDHHTAGNDLITRADLHVSGNASFVGNLDVKENKKIFLDNDMDTYIHSDADDNLKLAASNRVGLHLDEDVLTLGDSTNHTHVVAMKASAASAYELKQGGNSYIKADTAASAIIFGQTVTGSSAAFTALAVDDFRIDGKRIGTVDDADLMELEPNLVKVLGDISSSLGVQSAGYVGEQIGHTDDPDALLFEDQLVQTQTNVDFNIQKAGGLQLGGVSVSATALELNILDGDTARGTTALASGDGFVHNDAGTMRMTSIDKLADFFAGGGLAVSSGELSVGVDNSSIEINSDALRVKASGITNAMLAGSIEADKMNNGIFADLETLGVVDAADKFIVSSGVGAYAYETTAQVRTTLGLATTSDVVFHDITGEDGTFNGNVAIQGNLLVSGDTVTMNVENSEFADGIIGLGYASGSDDRTAGDRGLVMGLDSENDVAMIWDESESQFAFITTTQDANDVAINGNMTVTSYAALKVGALEASSISASIVKTIVDKNDTEIDNSGAGYQLASGDTLILTQDLLGDDRKVFLPASPAKGDVVEVKIKGGTSATRALQIKKGHDSQNIDGGEAIVLESDYAAVTLVATSAGNSCSWRVF